MKSFDEIFPEKAEEREKKNSQLKAQEEEDRQLFNNVFSTPNGEKALRRLMERCGYQKPNALFTSQGEERIEVLRVREAQRMLYLWIRKFVNSETLKRVEIGD